MPVLRPMGPRNEDEAHRTATQLELFFDLVVVVAIAAATESLHHAISEGHALQVLPNFIFVYVAIWWAWMNHTWFASAFDNDDAVYRGLTLVIMGGFLAFAGGVGHIIDTLDFGYGLWGWIIMRVGMIALWLRAAWHAPDHRGPALRYAVGIGAAQVLWTVLYLTTEPGSAAFFAAGILVFCVEFAVPVWSVRAGRLPWHRHHIIERYGLLNIIVLGEAFVSIALMVGSLYDGHVDGRVVGLAVASLVLIFLLWWLYFMEHDHMASRTTKNAFVWGYGHIFIFLSGALLAAGLAAYFDVLTDHSSVSQGTAALWVAGPVAGYLLAIALVRDSFHALGWRQWVLPVAGLGVAILGLVGVPPWGIGLALLCALLLRSPMVRQKRPRTGPMP